MRCPASVVGHHEFERFERQSQAVRPFERQSQQMADGLTHFAFLRRPSEIKASLSKGLLYFFDLLLPPCSRGSNGN